MKAARVISLTVLALAIAGGAYLYREKDAVMAFAGGTAAAPAAGTPGAAAAPGAAGAPGARPGGPGRPGGGRAAANVITTVAEAKDIPISVTAVGWVEASASVAVRSRIDGYVTKLAVTDGQMVKAGDLLVQLDDQAIQATMAKDRATMARDQATVDQLTADLARITTLAGTNNATRTQVDQAKTNLAVATANLAGDKALLQTDQLQLGFTTITAPIAGRVGVVSTTTGALVRASDQTPLVTVTRMAPVRITFTIPQRNLDGFRQALASAETTPVRAYDPTNGTLLSTGKLTFVDSTVDTTSGTVLIKAEFANADGSLWPGEYIRVETQLGLRAAATVVPIAAVQVNANGPYVYLVRNDRAVVTPVTVSDTYQQLSIISAGVRPGDHLIVEGMLRLVDGQAVTETLDTAAAAAAQAAVRAAARPIAAATPPGQTPAGAAPGQGQPGQARPAGAPQNAAATPAAAPAGAPGVAGQGQFQGRNPNGGAPGAAPQNAAAAGGAPADGARPRPQGTLTEVAPGTPPAAQPAARTPAP